MAGGGGWNEENCAGTKRHDEREVGELGGDEKVWTILPLFGDRFTLLNPPCCSLLLVCQPVLISDCAQIA